MQNTSMTNPNQPLRVGVRQAAAMLGISEPALRQLLKRKPDMLPVLVEGGRMTLSAHDVETYFSRKRNLPLLTENQMLKGSFIDIFRAGAVLLMPPIKILSLIRNGTIVGGVTMDNQLMLLASSVQRYATGEASHESADL